MLWLTATVVNAQFLPKAVSLNSLPGSPSPGQTFTVTASTPLFDSATSFFQWTINGVFKKEFSSTGKNSINLTAGPAGSTINVSVIVSKIDGGKDSDSIAIHVSDLNLIWFADTYKPKWYKGKSLPVQNSVVNVVAVPTIILDGSRIDPEDLIYRWGLDDQKNLLTGMGKQVFPVKISRYTKNPIQVKLTVEDIDKRIRKEGFIFLNPLEPLIVIYPFSPLGGVESRNGSGTLISAKRGLLDFVAEPFFFPVSSRRDLSYSWRVENTAVSGVPLNQNFLTVDTVKRTAGAIPISVTIKTSGDPAISISKLITLFLQ